jgi:hypothetical protein
MIKFTISEDELAKELDVDISKLDKIIDFFDSDPADQWELKENTDYIFIHKAKKIRKFSDRGALKIAFYLDAHGDYSVLHRIKDFLTQHSNKLRKALANRIIQEEFSEPQNKIIQANSRNFLHKQCLRRILETNGATMNRALEELRITKPLAIDFDFIEREFSDIRLIRRGQQLWFSSSGSHHVSRKISEILRDPARRKMCKVVSDEIAKALKLLDQQATNFQKNISNAKSKAKTRDKYICQVSRVNSKSKKPKIQVSAHHLYSINKYPHLATILDNLITVDTEIHQEFHVSWMGGNDIPCTVENFIDFIIDRYPQFASENLLSRLYHIKNVLKAD